MKPEEQLLLALGDVGDDLIEESMHLRFPRARWFRALPMVACCALILGAAMLLQNLEPLRESQITLPEGEDTVQEVLPPDTEAETTSRPFYVLNLDDDLYGAKQAVDQDGTVLVEVEQGKLYPLEDQSTGEVLAIAARDHLELGTPSDSPIVLYDLQGQLFTTLGAQYIACTGEVVAVIRSTGYELYRRSDGSLLTQGTGTVDLRGDFALCTDVDLGLCSLYNADGQLAAQFPSDRYDGGLLEWDGQFYFAVAGESGQLGLMDSHGTWVLEPAYEAITALALNRAVVSRDGEFQVISLETGEAVFTWPYHIYQIHAEGYVDEDITDLHYAFTTQPTYLMAKGPSTLKARYLTEDAPMALALYTSLGHAIGVDVSICESILTLAGCLMDSDYKHEGLTLERLGWGGYTRDQLIEAVS